MSGSIPAWKQAIYDRKKQQQKEEELKLAEKEAYLASLPPWKRALFLKKEAGGEPSAASHQGTVAKAAVKPTAKQQQSTTSSSAATQNKPSATAASAGAPAWKRKESPSSTIDSASKQQQVNKSSLVNTNNNNSDKSPSWSRKFTPTVMTASEPPSQKETSSATSALVNGMDNLPLWKRNLLQRQTAAAAATGDKQQPISAKVMDTPQTSVATGSSKPHNKLSNTSVRSHASDTSTANTISSSTTSNTASINTSENRPRAKSFGTYDDYDDKRLASLPPWKRDLILRKRAAAAKEKDKQTAEVVEPAPVVKVTRKESMDKDSGWKKTVHKSSPDDTSDNRSPIVRRISDDKISMWQKKAAADQSKPAKRVSQEIDPEGSDSQPVQQMTPTQQDVIQPVATQHVSNNTALVNGPEKDETDESAPPILRGKDPWAHLSESDPQFKALPPWKQALILRRRGDIRRRSNPDSQIDVDSISTNAEAEDEPDFTEVPAWKRETLLKRPAEKAVEDEAVPVFDDPDMPEWKKEKLRKSFQDKKKGSSHSSSSLPVLGNKKKISSYQSDSSIPEWKKEAMKEKQSSDDDIPEWKKEAMKEKQSLKKTNNDIPEWKKEKKQNAVKNDTSIPEWKKEAAKEKSVEKNDSVPLLTSIRPLSPDKGNPSSPVKPQSVDETDYHSSNHIDDDDDDDVPCTNIDDLSDSDESVGGSGSYDVNPDSTSARVGSASSGYSSDSNNTRGMKHQKSSKSILIIRKVSNTQPNRRRRVSWNEDQMHTEHTYPKYDYRDYDELNEEVENETTDSSVFSHPIHPSLGGNRTSRNSDNLSNYKPNMVSSYTVTVSTTKVETTKKEKPKTEPVAMPAEDPEFNMSNLSDDVAALLF